MIAPGLAYAPGMKLAHMFLASALALAACASKSTPAPTEPAPTEAPAAGDGPGVAPSAAMAPGACTAQGGEVRGDIGDGKIACAAGERDLGRVAQGIEGAVCCAPAAPPTP